MANFTGTAGNDSITGTAAADMIDASQGGSDLIVAGGGDDVIAMGNSLDALDRINGGAGYDRVELNGDYGDSITFGASTMRSIEELRIGGNFHYTINTHDNTVAAGQTLKIDAYSMAAGNWLTFNGSAEKDGSFQFYDGLSHDYFVGGDQSDYIIMTRGGDDQAFGGGGGDVISFNSALDSLDVADGGAGNDALYLHGDYSAGITFTSGMVKNIESISMNGDFTYSITTTDATAAAGAGLYFTGEGITGTGKMLIDASAETDSAVNFSGSTGDDALVGGALNDIFSMGNGGADHLYGGGGNDNFYMYDKFDASDWVFGGEGTDSVWLDGDYSAGLTFGYFSLVQVEDLYLGKGHDYKLTTRDTNVQLGQSLLIRGAGLEAGDTLDFDGSAETDGRFEGGGGAGNDTIRGGGQGDYLSASAGGSDKFYGNGGNDGVDFGAAFSAGDFFDGGDGTDTAYLFGDYGPLSLGAANLVNVEGVYLGDGHDFTITAQNSLVAAGAKFSVFGLYSDTFNFNGAAETDGSFEVTGGAFNDTMIGGAQGDEFRLYGGGNDFVKGNGGADVFKPGDALTALDSIDGGGGIDTLVLDGDYSAGFTFGATTMVNVEEIDLFYGHSYKLAMNDANTAAGRLMTVDGSLLHAGETLNFNGAAELDGRFSVTGGDGNDAIRTGAGNDLLAGGLGKDQLFGGAGNDRFVFTSIEDSAAGANRDNIRDFAAGDRIDLSGIDVNDLMAGDQAFAFIGDAAYSAAGQLRVTQAATFSLVAGDINGDGADDFQIIVTSPAPLTAADFIL